MTGTGYDFNLHYDGKCIWKAWHDGSTFEIPDGANVSSIIIPTQETEIQRYFLDIFIRAAKPLLIVGPTGTIRNL